MLRPAGDAQRGAVRGSNQADRSYVFRRAICGEQTRGYWQVLANLAYGIDPKRPSEALAVGLARQRDNYRFPNDDEFRRALEEQDIYGKRVCFDLLEAAGSDQD